MVAQVRGKRIETVFEVWPENWRAVQLFCRLETQWHYAPLGLAGAMRTGLRYGALETLLRMASKDVEEQEKLFDQVQVMEHAALDAWHEKKG